MLAQVLLILALLLILVGMIMVLLDAFKESFLWGLMVLLIPPLFVPIYSFVKWSKTQARNGFAMTLVGLVMASVGVYGGALQGVPGLGDHELVSNLPTASPKDQPLANEEAAAKVEFEDEEAYDPMLSTDKDRFSPSEIEPLAPKEDESVKSVGKSRSRAIPIAIEDLGSSLGAGIEITLNDGNKYAGVLVRTTEDSVSIEQQTSGGSISYEYTLDKIKSVVMISKPTKATVPPVVEGGKG
jgi:hypothetical protein